MPNCTHRWLLGPLCSKRNIVEQLHIKTTKLICNAITHANPVVNLMCKMALNDVRSTMAAQVAYLRFRYGITFGDDLNTHSNSVIESF